MLRATIWCTFAQEPDSSTLWIKAEAAILLSGSFGLFSDYFLADSTEQGHSWRVEDATDSLRQLCG